MIVFVGCEARERVAQDVGNDAAKIIALDICGQGAPCGAFQRCVDQTNDPVGFIQSSFDMLRP